jgi:hypothetical protein
MKRNILAENMRRFNTKNLKESKTGQDYKYWCEAPDMSRVGAEGFASDIDEAVATNDTEGIVTIAEKFVEWFHDDSIKKGSWYQKDGKLVPDLDDQACFDRCDVGQLQRATKLFKSNNNNQSAKNAIQNIIVGLFKDIN